jgi:hypothetical protein
MRFNPLAEQNNGNNRLCAWTQERLFAYGDSDLNAAEREIVQLHLDTCVACREELAQRRRSDQVLASARFDIPPAGDLRAGFYAKLAAANASPPPRRFGVQWRVALSACAVAGLALVFLRPALLPPYTGASSPVPDSPPSPEIYRRHGDDVAAAPVQNRQPLDRPTDTLTDTSSRSSGATDSTSLQMEARSREWKASTLRAKRIAIAAKDVPANDFDSNKVAALEDNSPVLYRAAAEVDDALKMTKARGLRQRMAQSETRSGEPRAFAMDALSTREIAQNMPAFQETQSLSAGVRDKAQGNHFYAELKSGLGKEAHETLALRQNRYAFDKTENGLTTFDSKLFDRGRAHFGVVVASAVPEEDDVTLEVHDEVRGFQTKARYASRTEMSEDGEVITIEADDNTSDAGSASSDPE